MTNLISPKKYAGVSRQIMHAEFQWRNLFQILTHLPFFDFHPVSYNTAIQNPSFTGQRFSPILLQKKFTLHKAGNENYHLLRCDTVKAGINLPTFRGTLIIVRLKSHNLHHLPHTSFTSGVLYASSWGWFTIKGFYE
jgi:hypothetical protein